jgi:general secretion pathway protein G
MSDSKIIFSAQAGSKAEHSKPNQDGFTLLEIMVVLVIIGVLAAVVAPRFLERADDAKVEACQIQMKNIGQALKLYRLQQGKYPNSSQGLQVLASAGKSGKRYLDSIPKDPWGNSYLYLSPGVHGDYDILSYGADGQAGGSGMDADIGNWQ